MALVEVPKQVSVSEIRDNDLAWSPSLYSRITLPTGNARRLETLLQSKAYDRGFEPGSFHYMERSNRFLIRTRALQDYSFLLQEDNEGIVPVNPKAFVDVRLRPGDILLSKDSSVGRAAIVDEPEYSSYMFSSGIVRLRPAFDRYYLLAYLKHPLFRAHLKARVPRGATIAHAKNLWLDCPVPIPGEPDSEKVVKYVSTLTQVIIDKERSIRTHHATITRIIHDELTRNSDGAGFQYSLPRFSDIKETLRLDTGLYGLRYQQFRHRVGTYAHGYKTLSELGVRCRRGPNLAVSVIGKSLYSTSAQPSWYELIRPTNISTYGTLNQRLWLGNPRELPLVKQHDIVFGCEATWRSMVLCEPLARCTTNFHGTVLSWPHASPESAIWLRCMLEYFREVGVIGEIAVGGQGGHFSPEYFDCLPIPCFPEDIRRKVASYYFRPEPGPMSPPGLNGYREFHAQRNPSLGIWQLDREARELRARLEDALWAVASGRSVEIVL